MRTCVIDSLLGSYDVRECCWYSCYEKRCDMQAVVLNLKSALPRQRRAVHYLTLDSFLIYWWNSYLYCVWGSLDSVVSDGRAIDGGNMGPLCSLGIWCTLVGVTLAAFLLWWEPSFLDIVQETIEKPSNLKSLSKFWYAHIVEARDSPGFKRCLYWWAGFGGEIAYMFALKCITLVLWIVLMHK